MDEFYRIKRLPPYVFAIVNDLKTKARARGEDIIDLGMGNPDRGTPKHIVAKLVEAAQNPRNHRYSASRGISRLRVARTQEHTTDLQPHSDTGSRLLPRKDKSEEHTSELQQHSALVCRLLL